MSPSTAGGLRACRGCSGSPRLCPGAVREVDEAVNAGNDRNTQKGRKERDGKEQGAGHGRLKHGHQFCLLRHRRHSVDVTVAVPDAMLVSESRSTIFCAEMNLPTSCTKLLKSHIPKCLSDYSSRRCFLCIHNPKKVPVSFIQNHIHLVCKACFLNRFSQK